MVTAANTVTYETLPNAALTNSSVTLGTTNVALGATAGSLAALNSVGLGVNGTTTGVMTLANGTSGGATTTVQPSTLTTTAWTMTLPSAKGTNGQVLQTDGSGNTSWISAATGSVTSVNMAVPTYMSVAGGPITSSGTLTVSYGNENANLIFAGPTGGAAGGPAFRSIVAADIPALPNTNLQNSSVTLGTTSVALGATASSLAALNSVGLGVNGTTTGVMTLANGTSGGATTTVQPSTSTTTAWTMTLPSAKGTNGQVLQTDGSGNTSWISAATGSVTSVNMSVPAILSVSGGPITSSGTLAVSLANENANLIFAGPTSGGAATPTFRSIVAADIPALPNTNLQNSSVTLGTTNVALGATAGSLAALNSVGLGVNGTTTGVMTLANGTSGGATTTVQPSTLTTTAWTMTLPSAKGTNGQVLQTDGSGNTSWISAATGSVTSVNMAVPTYMSVAGGPITSSGTLTVSYGNENANLIFAGPTGGAAGSPAFRSIVAADIPALPNTNLQNSSVTLGTTSVALGATASSLAALNSVGLGVNGTTTGVMTLANGTSGGATTTVQPSTSTTTAWTMTLPSAKGTNGQVLQTDGSGNTSWISAATGSVTSVNMSVPAILSVSGGPITSSGTLAVSLANENANLIFAGPTSGGAATPTFRSIVAADIPALPNTNLQNSSVTLGTTSVALGATASSLAALNSVGLGVNGTTTGVMTMANGTGGGATTTVQPSTLTTTAWTMTLPSAKGTNGQVLQTDGSGNTSWISAATGSVTSVNMAVPTYMSVAGGPITSSGTLTVSYGNENANLIFAGPTGGAAGSPAFRSIVAADIPALPNTNLQNSSVTLGTTSVALGATASSLAALNSVGLGVNGTTTGVMTLANGTSGGATTTVQPSTSTTTAWTMTLPSAKGTNGQVLQTDGSGNTSWISAATGSVTSVNMSVPAILSVSGGPITSSGTLAVSLANENANLIFAGPTSGGAATPTFRSIVAADIPALPNTNLQNSSVTLGTTSVALGATASSLAALNSVGLGVNGTTTGVMTLANGTSGGATTTVQPSTLTTTAWTMTLPSAKGTNGQVLQTDGSGNTSWISAATGSVTSVNMAVPTYMSVAGGPITSSGTLTVSYGNENANLIFAGPTGGAAGSPAFRSIVAADIPALPNTNLQNSSVTLGTTSVALGATASSLAALNSVGLGVNGTTTGVMTLANGTSGGATTTVQPSTSTTTAWTMTLPSAKGTNGQVLQTDGSGNTSWISAATGSVTSVNMSVPAILSVSGGPITSSGTLAVSLANENANLIFAGPTSGGAATPTFRSIVAADIPALPNTNLQNSSVTLGTTSVALGATASSLAALNSVGLGVNGTTTGVMTMANGTGGGATTTVQPSTLTTTAWTMTLPANKGTNAYVLQTDGSGNTSWVAQAGSGTVNSGTTSQLAYYSAGGTAVSGLTTAANGVLVTNASSVPSISATLPAAVQGNITSVGTVTSGTWNGTTIAIANGGTGQTTAAAAFNALDPMTTLGDVMYDSGGTTAARLAGNTTTTKMYMQSTGSGSAATAPAWAQIAFADLSGSITAAELPALTSADLWVGNGSNVATPVGVSGDVSMTNAGAFTVNKVNGVSYGAGPGNNTVPVVTSANTVTYEALPNAALANSSVTLGTTSVALGATASSLAALNSVGLGVNGTTTGVMTMANGTSGGATTTVQPSTSTTTAWTMTLPSAKGSNGQVLQTDGSGNTSWIAAGAGTCYKCQHVGASDFECERRPGHIEWYSGCQFGKREC